MVVFGTSVPGFVYVLGFELSVDVSYWKISPESSSGESVEIISGKTDAERLQIERKFYRYLSDYMLEDLKLLHMSAEELCVRMTYKNTEQYLELTEKYGGIIVMIPHYANYEWLIGMGAIMKPGDVPVQVYKPLRDQYLDKLFKRIRSRFGGYNIPKHSTAREIIKLKRDGKKMVVGLITDQWPSGFDRYWTTFLGQETAFLNGAERIAK